VVCGYVHLYIDVCMKLGTSLKQASCRKQTSKLYRELRVKAKAYYNSLTRYVWNAHVYS
jgi:hypothetical protein